MWHDDCSKADLATMNMTIFHSNDGAPASGTAFSLIELLTVISIIGLLMALGVGMAGVAGRKGREANVRAERDQLVTAIEAYHVDFNQYPPDNNNGLTNVNPGLNQLFYELSGSYSSNQGRFYQPADLSGTVTSTALTAAFRTQGIVNSAVAPERPKSYLNNLKPKQHVLLTLTGGSVVDVLRVSAVDWPSASVARSPLNGLVNSSLLAINPWQYVSTKPTNNPSGFDLWAMLPWGNTNRIIGNWKE
jgi:prepilin-type N-terminal cleavage/methylation domain-containing protein